MKAYLLTTGIVFLLIFAAHVARLVAEGAGLLRDPWFDGTSVLSVALAAWAWRLLRRLSRTAPPA